MFALKSDSSTVPESKYLELPESEYPEYPESPEYPENPETSFLSL